MDVDSFPKDLLSRKDKTYFNTAKQISKLSDHRQQMGCVVVNKHRIISSGYNSNSKCHIIQKRLDVRTFGDDCGGKLHAESSALIPFIKNNVDISGATLYIYREHRDGCLGMAKPCNRCMHLIKQCGIKKLKYTTEDGFATEVIA